MAQPPPRKGAYTKTVTNLHKEQLTNIQAKNQQELDLLDDIKNFMKQKATIEKNYAEGLLKLSSVYGTKKIACKLGLEEYQGDESGDQVDSSVGDQNIYKIWKRVLEENEKIANLRLAAAQVFQENISDDAKNLRGAKNMLAKKCLDRFTAIQRDVQVSVSELDRTRFIYFSEESDAIRVANRAEEAELKAKGKKKDVMSIFQSKTALEKQAGKLCAKQEELNIKSTGARNDYLLAVETANAHQERYYHADLQKTLEGMEGSVYDKMSEYLGTLAATELATCNAAHGSFTKIREQSEGITREHNYQCYLKTYTSLSDHVQYVFEPVEGDNINTITMPEDDAGLNYALNREAKDASEKYNNAIKMISAFRKRINSLCKAKKQMEHPDPSIDEKIEELENSIDNADTEKAKAEARLNKLREGGVSVDKYLDAISVCSDANRELEDANDDWGAHTDNAPEVEEVNYFSYDQISYGEASAKETAATTAVDNDGAWGATEDWGEQKQEETNQVTSSTEWERPSKVEEQKPVPVTDVDGGTDVVKAIVLYTFAGQNSDELAVTDNEEILILVRECDEEGWVMAQNLAGNKGLVPSTFVQAFDSQHSAAAGAEQSSTSFVPAMEPQQTALTIPSCPPPDVGDDFSSDEESDDDFDDDEAPPGLAPPPGPPPQLAPTPPGSTSFISLYDFEASRSDELPLQVDDIILVTSRTPSGGDDGWWLGEHNGKTGLFPASYVKEFNETEASSTNVDRDTSGLDEQECIHPEEVIGVIDETPLSDCAKSPIKDEPSIPNSKDVENKETNETENQASITKNEEDSDPNTDSDTENESNKSTETKKNNAEKKCAESVSDSSDSDTEDAEDAADTEKSKAKAPAIKAEDATDTEQSKAKTPAIKAEDANDTEQSNAKTPAIKAEDATDTEQGKAKTPEIKKVASADSSDEDSS